MVLRYEPMRDAIREARRRVPEGSPAVLLSAQGRPLDQATAVELAAGPGLVLVCGRYEGIDERVAEACVDMELSLGDYVLSGGELAAGVVIHAVTRLLPGTLGHEDSSAEDSFMRGLLDYPQYTRPERADGMDVPGVLLGGDHAAVRRWRLKQALGRTWLRRPDLVERRGLTEEERALLEEFTPTHLRAAKSRRIRGLHSRPALAGEDPECPESSRNWKPSSASRTFPRSRLETRSSCRYASRKANASACRPTRAS